MALRFFIPIAFIPCLISGASAPAATGAFERALELRHAALDDAKRGDYVAAARELGAAKDNSGGASADVRASILASQAEVFEHLGAWGDAIAAYGEAARIVETAYGGDDWRTSALQVRLSSAEMVTGQFASAEARLNGALQAQRRAPVCRKSEIALTLSTLAIVHMNSRQLGSAEREAQQAVRLSESMDADTADTAGLLGVLGGVYLTEGHAARALPLLTRAIDTLSRRLSPSDTRVAPLLVQRGLLLASDSKYALAEEDMRRAVTILDCADRPCVNADWARFHLSEVYLEEQKIDEADAILPQTVERQRGFLGKGRQLAFCIRELARLRFMQKRYREARELYREALAVSRGVAAPPQSERRDPKPSDIRRLEEQVRLALRPAARE